MNNYWSYVMGLRIYSFRIRIVVIIISTMLSLFGAYSFAERSAPKDIGSEKNDFYNMGVQAFNKKEYRQALDYFTSAQQDDLNNSLLDYNIGVANYKLGNYEEATAAFLSIVADDRMHALAQYNLGLIAKKQNDIDGAIDHFIYVYENADNGKVVSLAERQLELLTDGDSVDTLINNDVSFDITIATGNDDHLILSNQRNSDNLGDRFNTIEGNVNFPLLGDNTFLIVNLKKTNYYSQKTYNNSRLDVAINHSVDYRDIAFEIGADIENNWTNGDQYLTTTSFSIGSERALLDNLLLSADFSFSIYDASADNFYLNGYSTNLIFQLDLAENNWRVSPYYSFEYYNRDDIDRPIIFFSYSPSVHQFGVTATLALPFDVLINMDGGYSISKYHDPDRLLAYQQYRDDKNTFINFELIKTMFKNWEISGKVEYLNKDSNIKMEDYERAIFTISTAYYYE